MFVQKLLSSGRQSGCQASGQVGGEDLLLRGAQVVRHAAECDRASIRIEKRKGCAPVAVARLSDRARIDHIRRTAFKMKIPGLFGRDTRVFRIESFSQSCPHAKYTLNVRVTEERERDLGVRKRGQCVLQIDHIAVFVIGCAVYQANIGKMGKSHWTFGEFAKPRQMIRIEVIAIPQRRESGDRVEVFDIFKSGDHLVMIAANKNIAEAANSRSHLIRAGGVTDDVSKVENAIVRRGSGEARFQRFQVAVYVAEKKYAQSDPICQLQFVVLESNFGL